MHVYKGCVLGYIKKDVLPMHSAFYSGGYLFCNILY